ncbi:ATP-dependent helicase [Aquimonas sp.]|jgi:superfamily I DNA/RNA helicase|uniref:ATP-dependent helicase n=1 Tax=Aquimonas sp. TaxID=1872588 RepID=UPI0037BEC0AE
MLNEAQQRAVEAAGHCLVAAGPGSGKTRVLSERGARILRENSTLRLCAVTFTSDAAQELAHRMLQLVPNASRRIQHGTFHALCKKQLLASGRAVRLINDHQARDYLRRAFQVIVEEGFGEKFDEFESAVAKLKADPDAVMVVRRSITPSPDGVEVGPTEGSVERGFLLYQESLSSNGVLDFADLILQAVFGMRDGSVLPLQVEHLLVDEFQDTDAAQFAWMRGHLDAGVCVTIVGDDDQSIYGWRQALGYAGMDAFAKLAQAEHVVLDTTYRCARSIIRSAGQLILQNQERIPKNLRTASSKDGQIRVEGCRSREQELQLIVSRIKACEDPSSWAVLARTNALLDALEIAMSGEIEFVREDARSFWSLKGPRLFLGVVKSLVSNDMLGLDALLGHCGVGQSDLHRIAVATHSTYPGAALRFARQELPDLQALPAPARQLRAFLPAWMRALDHPNAAQGIGFEAIAEFMLTQVQWQGRSRTSPQVIETERTRLKSCVERFQTVKPTDLQGFIRRLENAEEKQTKTGPRLMTLHGSKGLEFDRVWLMACERGVFPPSAAIGKVLDEERRLMYVGMTRARFELTVSYSTANNGAASEFIEQAGLFAASRA